MEAKAIKDTPAPAANNAANGKRRKLLVAVLGAIAALGLAYGAYWAMVGRYFEYTDDAYVDGNVVQITPRVAGTVVAIKAEDTDRVRAGQELVELDPADAAVALQRAEAQLAQAVRHVRSLYAATRRLQADVEVRETALAKAKADLGRRERLASSGAVSSEDVQHARDALRSAESAWRATRQQLAANRALTGGTTLATHPEVRRAEAQVRDAYLRYRRTRLPAPVSGYVARRSIQVGQRVKPGTPLMAVVPLDQVWVDANFKEGQLDDIRVGEPATLTADAYGGVVYHGVVAGLGAGTGSAFALLPAQNATGNWIKVVQRLPVRIALDPEELKQHPLRVGLSMEVTVDVRKGDPARSPRLAPTDPQYRTSVFERQDRGADALITRILAENSAAAGATGKLARR